MLPTCRRMTHILPAAPAEAGPGTALQLRAGPAVEGDFALVLDVPAHIHAADGHSALRLHPAARVAHRGAHPQDRHRFPLRDCEEFHLLRRHLDLHPAAESGLALCTCIRLANTYIRS